jgi:hypothetical protein
MLKQLRLRPLLGLAILTGSWMLAGCGGDTTSTPAPSTTTPPANPPGTPDEAKKAP